MTLKATLHQTSFYQNCTPIPILHNLITAIGSQQASLKRLEDTFARYEAKVSMGYGAIEEDILFHIRIAECADNSVLRSMIMVLAQDIISQSNALESCSGERKNKALKEHKVIEIKSGS